MGKAIYTGVGGVARNVKQPYVGIGGVARKVTAGYIGVAGVARQWFTSTSSSTSSTITFYIESASTGSKIQFKANSGARWPTSGYLEFDEVGGAGAVLTAYYLGGANVDITCSVTEYVLEDGSDEFGGALMCGIEYVSAGEEIRNGETYYLA